MRESESDLEREGSEGSEWRQGKRKELGSQGACREERWNFGVALAKPKSQVPSMCEQPGKGGSV